MEIKYTDQEIDKLIIEEKFLPEHFQSKLKEKRGHKESELDITTVSGSQFRLILRQNSFNLLDFSIILGVFPPASNQLFRLKRYNGKCHEYTNSIENEKFYDFHIHIASERYQALGSREDAFAKTSNEYSDFQTALELMFKESNFKKPEQKQLKLL